MANDTIPASTSSSGGLAREALLALADTRAKALPTKDLERGLEEVIAKLEATDPLTPTLGMVLNSLEEDAQALRADRMRLADAWQDDPANLRRVALSSTWRRRTDSGRKAATKATARKRVKTPEDGDGATP